MEQVLISGTGHVQVFKVPLPRRHGPTASAATTGRSSPLRSWTNGLTSL